MPCTGTVFHNTAVQLSVVLFAMVLRHTTITLLVGITCTLLVAPFSSSNVSKGLTTTATLTADSDAAVPRLAAVEPEDLLLGRP